MNQFFTDCPPPWFIEEELVYINHYFEQVNEKDIDDNILEKLKELPSISIAKFDSEGKIS